MDVQPKHRPIAATIRADEIVELVVTFHELLLCRAEVVAHGVRHGAEEAVAGDVNLGRSFLEERHAEV